jgi:hypothetical protein
MMPTLLVLLVLLVVVWLGVRLVNQTLDPGLGRRERAELDGLRVLVDDLKETAWEHRELDSALSVIIIDKIRTHERRTRELGS